MSTESSKHEQMVLKLAKSGRAILADLTPSNTHLLHMAVGVSGEAGELLDAIKKLAIYNKPMTPEIYDNIVEELGDIEFYLAGIRTAMNIDRDRTLIANQTKLLKRYPNYKYSNQAAQVRADKQE